MRHSTFRQLEIFESITNHMSFTRAAEELFLTQPTVSMQMKKLADNIGLPLFERIGSQLYLTDTGRELHRTCQGIFEHLANFEMMMADTKGLKTGKLRLAVVTTAKYFAPRLLGMFCQQYPGVEVSLKVSNRERVLEYLASNQYDLCILSQPPEDVNIVAEAFLKNHLVVIAPLHHALAKKKKIPLALIAEEPFLLRESGSGTRMATERLFSAQGLKPKVRMELGSNEAIKQAVIGGLGISVLSSHTLDLEASDKQFAVLDVQGFPIKLHWYFVYPAGKHLSIVTSTFIDYLRQATKKPASKNHPD
jgi:LysR family transcriptional regulator, low CO2-responsive transcriptional regulator